VAFSPEQYSQARGISADGRTLCLVFEEIRDRFQPKEMWRNAQIQLRNLETGELQRSIPAKFNSNESVIIKDAIRAHFSENPSLIKLTTTIVGNVYLDISGEEIRFIGSDGIGGGAFSSDGRIHAFEGGEVVNAAPPFFYEQKNRHLLVQSLPDGEELFRLNAPDASASLAEAYKPMAFSPKGEILLFRDSTQTSAWAYLQAMANDLLFGELHAPKQVTQVRCLDMKSKESKLLLSSSTVVYWGDFLPDGQHVLLDGNVYRIHSKPWWVILSLALIPAIGLLGMYALGVSFFRLLKSINRTEQKPKAEIDE
jgi:hypothetical protein